MVTMTSAGNALKSYYLGVVSEQLDTSVNPLLAQIKKSTADVWGKEVRRLAQYGVNGGVGAGTEENSSSPPSKTCTERWRSATRRCAPPKTARAPLSIC